MQNPFNIEIYSLLKKSFNSIILGAFANTLLFRNSGSFILLVYHIECEFIKV